jgi:hypothetical protein
MLLLQAATFQQTRQALLHTHMLLARRGPWPTTEPCGRLVRKQQQHEDLTQLSGGLMLG